DAGNGGDERRTGRHRARDFHRGGARDRVRFSHRSDVDGRMDRPVPHARPASRRRLSSQGQPRQRRARPLHGGDPVPPRGLHLGMGDAGSDARGVAAGRIAGGIRARAEGRRHACASAPQPLAEAVVGDPRRALVALSPTARRRSPPPCRSADAALTTEIEIICREWRMKTKTLQQTVTFKASPRQVYDMLMDSRKHKSLSGQRAKISKKVGGKFTAWGSHISGINLVLKPGSKIVQAWRATGWGPAIYPFAFSALKR